jgi:hypothetical protein
MTILDQINAVHAGESVRAFVEEYEFRDPDYTPNDADKAMLEDAICGFVAKLDPVFTLAKQALELREALRRVQDICTDEDEDDHVARIFEVVSAALPTPPGGVE